MEDMFYGATSFQQDFRLGISNENWFAEWSMLPDAVLPSEWSDKTDKAGGSTLGDMIFPIRSSST
jgi:hypothetical protein